MSNKPSRFVTLKENNDGKDIHVGELDGYQADQMSEDTLVFLSQTNHDGIKDLISRPTWFFLKIVLGIDTFLDENNDGQDDNVSQMLVRPANKCTHAIPIISPSYRSRTLCVKELNTFMTRKKENDGIQIHPIIWNCQGVDGYCEELKSCVWTQARSLDPPTFLTEELWPRLLKIFNKPMRDTETLENHLSEYLDSIRGKHDVPASFAKFRKNRKFIEELKHAPKDI